MHFRPFRSFAAFVLTSLLLLGVATNAQAAGEKDKEALKLHDSAMNDDYLSTDFAKAEKKLRDALKRCGANGCTPALVGKINISLGTVLVVGLNKADAGKEALVAALKADAAAQLDKGLSTPELEAAYKEAKKAVGGGETPEKPEKPKKAPGGDLAHTPVKEQAVNTPVPVYIEVPTDLEAKKVTLRYKPFGGTAWKPIEMKKVGEGFGAEIPCDDVTTTGDIRYYITALDESNGPIAQAGTLKEPYKVAIKNDLEGEAPHLPGKKPPKACADKASCPPGLPGCPEAKRGEKPEGAACETATECQAGLVCPNGTCAEDKDAPGAAGKGKRNVVTLGVALDLLLISSGENVCNGADASYVCFYKDGGQFYGAPLSVSGTNGVSGGFGVGGARILLSYDRQIVKNLGLTLGARFGFALGGSPSSDTEPPKLAKDYGHEKAKSFLPIHAEGRVGYSFGGSVFEGGKFRPYVFLGGGLAQINAAVPVTVCDQANKAVTGPVATDPKERAQVNCAAGTVKGVARDVEVYQITGLNFLGFGGGALYGITPNFGVAAEIKVMIMVPTFGVVFAPQLGPAVAF